MMLNARQPLLILWYKRSKPCWFSQVAIPRIRWHVVTKKAGQGWGFQASSSGNWWLWTVDSGQTTWPTKSSSGNWWARVLARGQWPHKPRGQKISSDSWWSIKNINNKSGSLVVDKENRNNKSGSRRSIYGRWQWASIKQQKVPELTNLRKVCFEQKR